MPVKKKSLLGLTNRLLREPQRVSKASGHYGERGSPFLSWRILPHAYRLFVLVSDLTRVSPMSKVQDLQVVYRDPAELIPYARNARTHSDDQVQRIAASIKEFGFTQPILLDGQNGVLAGHAAAFSKHVLDTCSAGTRAVPCVLGRHPICFSTIKCQCRQWRNTGSALAYLQELC